MNTRFDIRDPCVPPTAISNTYTLLSYRTCVAECRDLWRKNEREREKRPASNFTRGAERGGRGEGQKQRERNVCSHGRRGVMETRNAPVCGGSVM